MKMCIVEYLKRCLHKKYELDYAFWIFFGAVLSSVMMSSLLSVVPSGQQVISVSCFLFGVSPREDTCPGFTMDFSRTT